MYPQMKKGISRKNIDEILRWVDGSYEVCHTMKRQTEGAIYMGLGVTNCRSSNQKLNTKSSTKSELVNVSDYVP